jgi:uncharacterized protein YjbJ (UPF0337 family)
MGEFTDRLKGAANQAAGTVKQESANPETRDEGAAQELKGIRLIHCKTDVEEISNATTISKIRGKSKKA